MKSWKGYDTEPEIPIFHRAKWLVMDPWTIVRDGFVKIEDGEITGVGQGKIAGNCHIKDHGHGALMPAMINAHTHLELCALSEMIPVKTGFRRWVAKLLKEREKIDRDILHEAALEGIKGLMNSGCSAVAEVATLGLTRDLFINSEMFGIWFKEYLGDRNRGESERNSFISSEKTKRAGDAGGGSEHSMTSCAIHGPHTTDPELISAICDWARKLNRPYSVHLAESEDEVEFITTGKGAWADFLSSRNIGFSRWELPARSPVAYMAKIGALNENTIAVHALRVDDEDLKTLAGSGVRVCLCPRSNRNLHDKLPDIQRMLELGIKPGLGTDSLASVETLNMFDEMSFVRKVYPTLDSKDIFEMATISGARVLGLERCLGSLVPGKRAAMIFASVDGNKAEDILDEIVNGKFEVLIPIFLTYGKSSF